MKKTIQRSDVLCGITKLHSNNSLRQYSENIYVEKRLIKTGFYCVCEEFDGVYRMNEFIKKMSTYGK